MKIAIYKWIVPFVVILALVQLTGCEENFMGRQYDTDEEYMQIYDYIKTRPDLSIYKAISDYSGFYSQISTAGTYTAFAAVDSAWTNLYEKLKIKDYRDKSPEYWLMYMKYSTLETQIHTNSLNGGKMTQYTMLDKNYFLSVDVSSFTAIKLNNSAVIIENNKELKNGYLNLIDAVLEPPITPVYDLLKEDGRFGIMLSLFEENGLKPYLTDSLVTLFIEPDVVFEDDFDPRTDLSADSLQSWLKYHILPGNRYFVNDLDKKMLQPLYEKDVITFNKKTVGDEGKGSIFLNQQFRVSTRTDRNALNGVVHEMFNVIQMKGHTAGTIETNLFGATNTKKGYTKNVFADAPAMVRENMNYSSYHQLQFDVPYPPICMFVAAQAGDVFRITVPDVAPGVYTVRMIYNNAYSSTLRLIYQDVVVKSGIAMGTADGDFPEYTTLKYKDCGTIEVNERGDVALKFLMEEASSLLMDRIDLIPNITF